MFDLDPARAFAAAPSVIAAARRVEPAPAVEAAGAVESRALPGEDLAVQRPLDGGVAFQVRCRAFSSRRRSGRRAQDQHQEGAHQGADTRSHEHFLNVFCVEIRRKGSESG